MATLRFRPYPGFRCFNCQGVGHYTRACPLRGRSCHNRSPNNRNKLLTRITMRLNTPFLINTFTFICGELYRHSPVWSEILKGSFKRDQILSYIQDDVNVHDFFQPFCGRYQKLTMITLFHALSQFHGPSRPIPRKDNLLRKIQAWNFLDSWEGLPWHQEYHLRFS